MDELFVLVPFVIQILFFLALFFIAKKYIDTHPSPILRKMEEQNRTLILKVEELEEKINLIEDEAKHRFK